jgi:hypothetical protein
MWNVNPEAMMVAYVANKRAMERYCREEGIPAQPMPDLVSNDDDVLAGVRHVLRAVWRVLTLRRISGRRKLDAAGQGGAAQ